MEEDGKEEGGRGGGGGEELRLNGKHLRVDGSDPAMVDPSQDPVDGFFFVIILRSCHGLLQDSRGFSGIL